MLGPCLQEIFYTTRTVVFPTFLGRCSHKPGILGELLSSYRDWQCCRGTCSSKRSSHFAFSFQTPNCFAFNYAQQKQLRQIYHCCSIHNDLQNRSEPEQLLHKLELNVQMKTRKQTKRSTLLHYVPLHKTGLRRDVCSSFPQESKIASCFPC